MVRSLEYDLPVCLACVSFIQVSFVLEVVISLANFGIVTHTLVLFYSLVSLNVAINSYDNALLTLLLSNQFVEIKSAVFKKFEKENLFQMSCAGSKHTSMIH